jgi:hypothetical protein
LSSPSQIPHPISKFDGQLLSSAPQLSITLSPSGFVVIYPSVRRATGGFDAMKWYGRHSLFFLYSLACLLDYHDSWTFVVFVMMQGEKSTVDLIVLVGCKVNDKRVPEADKVFVVVARNFKFRDSLLVAI